MSQELLLVDDDETFCMVLARAMTRRGFTVRTAQNVSSALILAEQLIPAYVVLDLKMAGETGLSLIAQLRQLNPAVRIVMLTGYASIATAVDAIKLGATHYLAKPAEVDEIVAALRQDEVVLPVVQDIPTPSLDRLEWEHIQRVLNEHDGNISATARALNMHRRTLQRKLFKHPVKV
ncbi:response regulator transcription factor [Sulfuriferula nivalis]|jgi:two-component system response regulator RegA|uniref:DNA-binding response regulator n=1 Tax=Sulfuriferula nivalis TaxID=2675298 RepID=A0A809SBD5_9PROT|nr:response regulator transcription factor [Sulfuriferula nivalis]BBP02222.1 DNA-binding response regulator [Sulfuriferula nivalis]